MDRRAAIEAILTANGIPGSILVQPFERDRSGLAVAPNGLVIRVVTNDLEISAARLELLSAWLGVAAAILRNGGVPVLMSRTGVEATLGAAPLLPADKVA
jgi:hypothetical protein